MGYSNVVNDTCHGLNTETACSRRYLPHVLMDHAIIFLHFQMLETIWSRTSRHQDRDLHDAMTDRAKRPRSASMGLSSTSSIGSLRCRHRPDRRNCRRLSVLAEPIQNLSAIEGAVSASQTQKACLYTSVSSIESPSWTNTPSWYERNEVRSVWAILGASRLSQAAGLGKGVADRREPHVSQVRRMQHDGVGHP